MEKEQHGITLPLKQGKGMLCTVFCAYVKIIIVVLWGINSFTFVKGRRTHICQSEIVPGPCIQSVRPDQFPLLLGTCLKSGSTNLRNSEILRRRGDTG